MPGRRISAAHTRDVMYGGDGSLRIMLGGMHDLEDIVSVNEARPDLCGFQVNWPSSYRSVGREVLRRMISGLDQRIPAVGVFYDQPLGYVAELADEVLDVVQLQGTEDNAYIRSLRNLVDVPIIQGVCMHGPKDVDRANQSDADMLLLCDGWGVGRPFDWTLAEQVDRPFILSGGLNPDNVAGGVARLHPWGVDVNSYLEFEDGHKDPRKMRDMVEAVRSLDAAAAPGGVDLGLPGCA